MIKEHEVVVLGGGITGLVLHYLLRQAGVDSLLLEANASLGGAIQTNHQEGFVLEQGPNTILADSNTEKLLHALSLKDARLHSNPEAVNRYLLQSNRGMPNRLVPLPRSIIQALSTPLLSARGKMRCLLEPFFARRENNDCSIATFSQNHFGQEFTESIVAAGLNGIWAGKLSALSAQCCLPSVWNLAEKERSLVLAVVKKLLRKKSTDHTATTTPEKKTLLSFSNGLETLITALEQRSGTASVMKNTKVLALQQRGSQTVVKTATQEFCAKRVFSCLPAQPTATLLKQNASELAAAIARIPHASLGVLHIAVDRASVQHPLDGFGFLVAPKHRMALLGCIFSSSIFPDNAPTGKVLLTCFSGGATAPENAQVQKREVQQHLLKELSDCLEIRNQPDILQTKTWNAAIPQYQIGHQAVRAMVDRFHEAQSEVRLLGNWLDGISVPNRIQAAQLAAKNYLAARPL